jgi:hypothetical protein
VTILLFVNEPMLFDHSWLRYLKGQLRRALPWREVPIKLVLRSRLSVAKKSGMMARRMEGMGALATSARWIDDSPTSNVRDVADLLDQDTVRDVLNKTLGRSEDEDEDEEKDEGELI